VVLQAGVVACLAAGGPRTGSTRRFQVGSARASAREPPLPERPVFVHLLGRAVPFFDRRHLVRPGVNGWAVVRFGYSDSVRDKWIIHEYDLYYLKHRPALLDLEIASRTLLVMLTRRGQ